MAAPAPLRMGCGSGASSLLEEAALPSIQSLPSPCISSLGQGRRGLQPILCSPTCADEHRLGSVGAWVFQMCGVVCWMDVVNSAVKCWWGRLPGPEQTTGEELGEPRALGLQGDELSDFRPLAMPNPPRCLPLCLAMLSKFQGHREVAVASHCNQLLST